MLESVSQVRVQAIKRPASMIEKEDPVIANSLWSATANSTPECPELRADVAIIGAGAISINF